MKVVIAGGGGFIGRALTRHFSTKGAEVVVLARQPKASPVTRTVVWDGIHLGAWAQELKGTDLLINLAGSPISARWTTEGKQTIRDSRICATLALQAAAQDNPPKVWINASATGFYGDRGTVPVDEKSLPGSGFLADVCEAWEASFAEPTSGTRKIVLRIGVVLGRDAESGNLGGALEALLPLAKLGLGGQIGNGKQFLPWIHLDDLVRLTEWAAGTEEVSVINGVSPGIVTNREFMRAIRREVGMKFGLPAPALALKIASKLFAFPSETVLDGAMVLPQVALSLGFSYAFADLENALQAVLGPPSTTNPE